MLKYIYYIYVYIKKKISDICMIILLFDTHTKHTILILALKPYHKHIHKVLFFTQANHAILQYFISIKLILTVEITDAITLFRRSSWPLIGSP